MLWDTKASSKREHLEPLGLPHHLHLCFYYLAKGLYFLFKRISCCLLLQIQLSFSFDQRNHQSCQVWRLFREFGVWFYSNLVNYVASFAHVVALVPQCFWLQVFEIAQWRRSAFSRFPWGSWLLKVWGPRFPWFYFRSCKDVPGSTLTVWSA